MVSIRVGRLHLLSARSIFGGQTPEALPLVSARLAIGCAEERVRFCVTLDPDGFFSRESFSNPVATGGGLRVAALWIEHGAKISAVAAVVSVAIPLAVFFGSLFALYFYLVRRFGLSDVSLALATAVVISVAVVAALSGMSTEDGDQLDAPD
jgi:hypothetical protein